MSNSKQQKRKNKKYVPRKLGNVAILNRLPVPESQILHLKARHDAILLRLYMGTDTFQGAPGVASTLVQCALSLSNGARPWPR